MILGGQVEWVLHCCAVLAVQPEGSYVATKDLAEFHGVPKEYLSKALQALSQAGLVTSTLGPRGGYQLAKPSIQITFLDIVEAVGGRHSTFACKEIRGNNPCLKPKEGPRTVCGIAKVMYKADEAWRRELRAVSLADIAAYLTQALPKEMEQSMAKWFERKLKSRSK